MRNLSVYTTRSDSFTLSNKKILYCTLYNEYTSLLNQPSLISMQSSTRKEQPFISDGAQSLATEDGGDGGSGTAQPLASTSFSVIVNTWSSSGHSYQYHVMVLLVFKN